MRLAGASPSTIHHPPDEAATETAQIIAQEVGTKLKVNDDLADPDLGLLEGMLEQRFAEQHPKRYKQWEGDPLSLVPPEGEPFADARARIFLTLGKLLKKSRAAELGIELDWSFEQDSFRQFDDMYDLECGRSLLGLYTRNFAAYYRSGVYDVEVTTL